MPPTEPTTVVMDVDGTLVDTNYEHAIAWHRALRGHGYAVQVWEIHPHIGMGAELREAGAAEVFRSIGELRKDRAALKRLARRQL